jgi:hypothetical protein
MLQRPHRVPKLSAPGRTLQRAPGRIGAAQTYPGCVWVGPVGDGRQPLLSETLETCRCLRESTAQTPKAPCCFGLKGTVCRCAQRMPAGRKCALFAQGSARLSPRTSARTQADEALGFPTRPSARRYNPKHPPPLHTHTHTHTRTRTRAHTQSYTIPRPRSPLFPIGVLDARRKGIRAYTPSGSLGVVGGGVSSTAWSSSVACLALLGLHQTSGMEVAASVASARTL